MKGRLGWFLRSLAIIAVATAGVVSGALLGQYGKTLFNAAML